MLSSNMKDPKNNKTLQSKDQFGDAQLHVEFATPTPPKGESQGRGNSGVFLMGKFETQVLDTEAYAFFLLRRYRIVPYRSYVKGWNISPSHYVNQDLAAIWLDK